MNAHSCHRYLLFFMCLENIDEEGGNNINKSCLDGNGLFWKRMQTKTFISKEEKPSCPHYHIWQVFINIFTSILADIYMTISPREGKLYRKNTWKYNLPFHSASIFNILLWSLGKVCISNYIFFVVNIAIWTLPPIISVILAYISNYKFMILVITDWRECCLRKCVRSMFWTFCCWHFLITKDGIAN